MNILEFKEELKKSPDIYVLCVDDEADILEYVNEKCLEFGFKVISTTDTSEAIEFVKTYRNSLALIISDLMMPVMNGFELRTKLLQIAPEVPFLIFSAHIDKETALKGLDLKICGFLSKPMDHEKFNETIIRESLPRINSIVEDRELRNGFVLETESLIQNGEELLLELEQNPSSHDAINQFFGIIHTLKGASSFFDPKTLHKFAHKYEDILKQIQKGEIKVNENVSQVLFSGYDVLKELFNEFKENKYSDRNLEQLLLKLSLENSKNDTTGAVVVSKNKAQDTKDQPAAQINKSKTEDVRVAVALLDEFIQLSGEVTVIRNMLNKCVRSIERKYSGDRDIIMLSELLDELHKINGGMQGKISDIRKVPMKSVLKALPRAVRDVSKALNKKIDFETTGEDLRVDTSLAEVLNNSLLHIVKNSIDHGLENAEERKKSGKNEVGKVTVKAWAQNENVFVSIEDDGKGINEEAIKKRLIKNGLHQPSEIEKMPKEEIYQMIFASGFSTAAQVTDISGRGVGMSMVKDSVQAVGGEIKIESNPGQGAKFTLVLPAPKSVLIASCLSVRGGKHFFGIISDDIIRVLNFETSKKSDYIRDLDGCKTLLLDDELIPIGNINNILGLQENSNDTNETSYIVLSPPQDGRKVALEVNQILDFEDTVIKSIHPTLNKYSAYLGATFLDDGTIGTVLNTAGLIDLIGVKKSKVKTKQTSKDKDQNLGPVPEWALIVSLSQPGLYAVEQKDIFRLEELEQSIIKHSGINLVAPYREGIIEILDLNSVFGSNQVNETQTDLNSKVPVFVVQNGGAYYGIKVNSVIDMCLVENINQELACKAQGIKGHFFLNEKTVTLLSVERCIEILKPVEGAAVLELPQDQDASVTSAAA